MTLAVAFVGGVISCLSPCVLPVVPVFLANLRGSFQPQGAASQTDPGRSAAHLRGAAFLVGFAGVFVVLWMAIGLGGSVLLANVPALRLPVGLTMALIGTVIMVGRIPVPAMRWRHGGSVAGSFLLGAGVAIGWTPCIGPTLGAILSLAIAAETVWAGAALLAAYALGMILPMAVLALGMSRLRRLSISIGRHESAVRFASGVTIIVVGGLVATNGFSRLAGLIPWSF